MSGAALRKRLLRLARRHRDLVERAAGAGPMVRGSLHRVETRCGKPTCRCARGRGLHRHLRLTWRARGRSATRRVPAPQEPAVAGLTRAWRAFRSMRRDLAALEAELRETLDRYAEALDIESRKRLGLGAGGAPTSADRMEPSEKPPRAGEDLV